MIESEILSNTTSDSMRIALDRVSDDTLVYIMAVMLYGRADGCPGAGTSFEDVLAEARRHFEVSGRALIAQHVQGKHLSRYLPAGLARLNRKA